MPSIKDISIIDSNKAAAKKVEPPYGRPDNAARRMLELLRAADPARLRVKRFHDSGA